MTWSLARVVGDNKNDDAKKCRKIAGNFDHHEDVWVQSRAHHPMKHIKGFTRSHWMHQASVCTVLPWRPPWSRWKTQNTNKNDRPKPKVVRILGGRGHLSICVFVLYLYQKIPLKKCSTGWKYIRRHQNGFSQEVPLCSSVLVNLLKPFNWIIASVQHSLL